MPTLTTRSAKGLFAALFAVLFTALPAAATEFSALTVGQPLADGKVTLGNFTVKLPEGNWTVVAKVEARAGSQAGTSATPTQLTTALARVDDKKVRALFIFRTPASTFTNVSRWQDEPCKGFDDAIAKDTMKATFNMPECFAVTHFDPNTIRTATGGSFGQFKNWLKDNGAALPDKLLRVYYTKYQGGDFLHANLYLPADAQPVPAAEAWGRKVAAELQKVVTRDAAEGVLAALP